MNDLIHEMKKLPPELQNIILYYHIEIYKYKTLITPRPLCYNLFYVPLYVNNDNQLVFHL